MDRNISVRRPERTPKRILKRSRNCWWRFNGRAG